MRRVLCRFGWSAGFVGLAILALSGCGGSRGWDSCGCDYNFEAASSKARDRQTACIVGGGAPRDCHQEYDLLIAVANAEAGNCNGRCHPSVWDPPPGGGIATQGPLK